MNKPSTRPDASPLLPGCLGAQTLRLADAEALRTLHARNDAPYAIDQDRPSSLTAVTAKANRVGAGKEPAEWLPPAPTYRCLYETVPVDTK